MLINYQGYLTDDSGTPLSGKQSVNFRLYSTETGGFLFWAGRAARGGSPTVFFDVQLGAVNQLFPSVFNLDTIYLEIQIFNADSIWETLRPRQQFTSTAFAVRANNADMLEGYTLSELDDDYVNIGEADAVTSVMIADSSIGADDIATIQLERPQLALLQWGTTELADNAVTTNKLADYALTSIKMADEAVTSAKIADDTITTADIHDGSGSGLDADLLDGLDAASFAPSVHNHDGQYYSKAYVDALEDRIAALEAKLQYLAVVADSINGMPGPHVIITGANLHVRSGSGSTYGTINGLGNLIIGYNEDLTGEKDRSGSHNVVVGRNHNYSSFGGFVVGTSNTISGQYSSVSGG